MSSQAPLLSQGYTLPDDPKDMKASLESELKNIAEKTNVRDIAIYDLIENQNGQQWFLEGNIQNKRFGYRICYYETLAGVATNIPHGIANIDQCRITRLYGTIQNSPFTTAVPIPNGGPANTNLSIGPVNIVVGDPTGTYPGYVVYVVVEFVYDR